MDAFSKRLRFLRNESGKLQTDISQDLNLSRGTLSAYENGREAPYDALIAIAAYFNVTTDYLLGLSPDKQPAGDIISSTLATAAPIIESNGGDALPSSDLATLASHLLDYYRAGAPAGNAPLEALRAYLRNVDTLLSATLTGSTAHVLDAVNRFAVDFVNINAVMDAFLRKNHEEGD